MAFTNVYERAEYADAYARLEFPGTYRLAFRDLPAVFARHAGAPHSAGPGARPAVPRRALDFGCGAGRSTRFLARCGFDAVGVDVSAEILRKARETDPAGDYRLIADGDFACFAPGTFDLVLAAFPFDNIPTLERKAALLAGLRSLLRPAAPGEGGAGAGGVLVNLVSSPEIYLHQWASFSTSDFPENRRAGSGDVVRIVNLAIASPTPCEDVLWTEQAWRETYAASGLEVVEVLKPLAGPADPGPWVSETAIAPWTVWVVREAGG